MPEDPKGTDAFRRRATIGGAGLTFPPSDGGTGLTFSPTTEARGLQQRSSLPDVFERTLGAASALRATTGPSLGDSRASVVDETSCSRAARAWRVVADVYAREKKRAASAREDKQGLSSAREDKQGALARWPRNLKKSVAPICSFVKAWVWQ